MKATNEDEEEKGESLFRYENEEGNNVTEFILNETTKRFKLYWQAKEYAKEKGSYVYELFYNTRVKTDEEYERKERIFYGWAVPR